MISNAEGLLPFKNALELFRCLVRVSDIHHSKTCACANATTRPVLADSTAAKLARVALK